MIVIIMISLILYLIVANSIYHAMPEIKKEKKLIYILVGFLIVFIITYILTNIATTNQINIDKEKLSISKQVAIFLIAPINSLILMPIGSSISKCKGKRITKEKLNKKILIYTALFIVCILFEKAYIQNFIQGLLVSGT